MVHCYSFRTELIAVLVKNISLEGKCRSRYVKKIVFIYRNDFMKLLICNVYNIVDVVIVAEVFSTLHINVYVKSYRNYILCMYIIHVKFI